jgi:allophanate hydrolase subunit 2
MADAQTTGGYPVCGVVVAADLPLAAQLLPGDALRLAPVSLDEALAARRAFAAWCAAEPEEDGVMEGAALAGWPG